LPTTWTGEPCFRSEPTRRGRSFSTFETTIPCWRLLFRLPSEALRRERRKLQQLLRFARSSPCTRHGTYNPGKKSATIMEWTRTTTPTTRMLMMERTMILTSEQTAVMNHRQGWGSDHLDHIESMNGTERNGMERDSRFIHP